MLKVRLLWLRAVELRQIWRSKLSDTLWFKRQQQGWCGEKPTTSNLPVKKRTSSWSSWWKSFRWHVTISSRVGTPIGTINIRIEYSNSSNTERTGLLTPVLHQKCCTARSISIKWKSDLCSCELKADCKWILEMRIWRSNWSNSIDSNCGEAASIFPK